MATDPVPLFPRSRFVRNGAVRVHYLDRDPGPAARGLPVLMVPGFGEEAAEHVDLLTALGPRRALAVDLRGRGRSDAPRTGYALDDHLADLEAIVAAAGLGRFHLVAYSRGTTYALGWALRHPDAVASTVIGDYPARQIVPPRWFVDRSQRGDWRGRPIVERTPAHAIEGIVGEAVALEWWDELPRLVGPVLVIRGCARGALLDDQLEARYREHLPQVEIVRFEESGHDLWDPDPTRFPATVAEFLGRVDPL